MHLGFRADIIVEGKLIIALKSVEVIAPVHPKILLTYLKLTNMKLGLLINFNDELIKNGIKRIVNNLKKNLAPAWDKLCAIIIFCGKLIPVFRLDLL